MEQEPPRIEWGRDQPEAIELALGAYINLTWLLNYMVQTWTTSQELISTLHKMMEMNPYKTVRQNNPDTDDYVELLPPDEVLEKDEMQEENALYMNSAAGFGFAYCMCSDFNYPVPSWVRTMENHSCQSVSWKHKIWKRDLLEYQHPQYLPAMEPGSANSKSVTHVEPYKENGLWGLVRGFEQHSKLGWTVILPKPH